MYIRWIKIKIHSYICSIYGDHICGEHTLANCFYGAYIRYCRLSTYGTAYDALSQGLGHTQQSGSWTNQGSSPWSREGPSSWSRGNSSRYFMLGQKRYLLMGSLVSVKSRKQYCPLDQQVRLLADLTEELLFLLWTAASSFRSRNDSPNMGLIIFFDHPPPNSVPRFCGKLKTWRSD